MLVTQAAMLFTFPDPVSSHLLADYLHYDMAKSAVEAGFHVMCEKPIAVSAAEAETRYKLCFHNNLG